MEKSQKSQIVKLSLVALLLLITPLLSGSMRRPYLYFIFNLVIIALGAEAGLLSFSSKPHEEKRPPHVVVVAAPKPVVIAPAAVEAFPADKGSPTPTLAGSGAPERVEQKAKVVEKSASEKIVAAVKIRRVKKCPSTPSLFFIGDGDVEAEETQECEEEEEVGLISGQELFTKAETFIGNFYKQLKMQKEESWKRIHGFYQKAF